MNSARLAGLALMLAAFPLLNAAPAIADTLAAVSGTAMSITGDIEFDNFEMVFENGKRLEFDELVADSFMVGGAELPASVYSVSTPADPKLNNGNRLCGQGKVTYVAAWSDPSDDTLTVIAVFDTQDVPGSDAEMCASYTYQYQ